MKFDKLKEFIAIAKEAGASGLEYKEGDHEFSVSFPVAQQAVQQPMYYQAAAGAAPVSATSAAASAAKNEGLVDVISPFVGTYYSSPSPDSPAYAKKGDKVSKGDVMCIIEAMKIMNEIESEASGEIVEVCVENESYVEFGQVLFRIRP